MPNNILKSPWIPLLSILLVVLLSTQQLISSQNQQPAGDQKSAAVSKLLVSAVQFPVSGRLTLAAYLEKFEKTVRLAKEEGRKQKLPQLIVFPELMAVDLLFTNTLEDQTFELKEVAKLYTPQVFEFVQTLSKELDVSILAGSYPRLEGKEIRNTAFLAMPDGTSIQQDKIFLTPYEKLWGWTGGEKVKIFEAPWGLTAIFICYDAEIPHLANLVSQKPLDLLLVPSMTETTAGFRRVRWTAQAHSIYHYNYVVHTGTIGTSDVVGNNHGQASILAPSDRELQGLLKEGNANQEEIVHSVLDFDLLRRQRANAGIHPARDQRARDLSKITLELSQ